MSKMSKLDSILKEPKNMLRRSFRALTKSESCTAVLTKSLPRKNPSQHPNPKKSRLRWKKYARILQALRETGIHRKSRQCYSATGTRKSLKFRQPSTRQFWKKRGLWNEPRTSFPFRQAIGGLNVRPV